MIGLRVYSQRASPASCQDWYYSRGQPRRYHAVIYFLLVPALQRFQGLPIQSDTFVPPLLWWHRKKARNSAPGGSRALIAANRAVCASSCSLARLSCCRLIMPARLLRAMKGSRNPVRAASAVVRASLCRRISLVGHRKRWLSFPVFRVQSGELHRGEDQ